MKLIITKKTNYNIMLIVNINFDGFMLLVMLLHVFNDVFQYKKHASIKG